MSLANWEVVLPKERLPLSVAVPMGFQHLIAMSESTIPGPLLMVFDPNLAILLFGIGTLTFIVCSAGRELSFSSCRFL